MHRLLSRFVVGAGVLLVAATVQAQGTSSSERPFKIGGALGASIPLGDFGDAADLGFHLGGLIEYKPQSLPVNLRGEVTYNRFGLKEGAFGGNPALGDVDGNASILNFLGNVVIPFGDANGTGRPHVIGGLGVYRLKFSGDFAGFDISDTETKFGINVGAGYSFNLSGFDAFVEARFHSIFTEGSNTTMIPLSFGFRF